MQKVHDWFLASTVCTALAPMRKHMLSVHKPPRLVPPFSHKKTLPSVTRKNLYLLKVNTLLTSCSVFSVFWTSCILRKVVYHLRIMESRIYPRQPPLCKPRKQVRFGPCTQLGKHKCSSLCSFRSMVENLSSLGRWGVIVQLLRCHNLNLYNTDLPFLFVAVGSCSSNKWGQCRISKRKALRDWLLVTNLCGRLQAFWASKLSNRFCCKQECKLWIISTQLYVYPIFLVSTNSYLYRTKIVKQHLLSLGKFYKTNTAIF